MSALAKIPRRKFTVDEFHYLAEKGVFAPDERLELFEGEIVKMSPIGKRHAGCVDFLVERLVEISNRKYVVRGQNPILLHDKTEPQPDVSILKRRADFYRRSSAKAADVLLLMEVSDSTLSYDRNHKLPAYSSAGIAETWLIDLENDIIEIHSKPTAKGYGLVQILRRGEIAKSGVLSEIEISVDEILG